LTHLQLILYKRKQMTATAYRWLSIVLRSQGYVLFVGAVSDDLCYFPHFWAVIFAGFIATNISRLPIYVINVNYYWRFQKCCDFSYCRFVCAV